MGFEVTTASTVSAGLAALRSTPFDLLLSDIGLPDGSGYDLLRQTPPDHRPPAVALSGFGMDEDLERSRQAGFLDHLTKPVDAAHLESVLLRAVGRGK
jgi:CheY-like chemotaxis protein